MCHNRCADAASHACRGMKVQNTSLCGADSIQGGRLLDRQNSKNNRQNACEIRRTRPGNNGLTEIIHTRPDLPHLRRLVSFIADPSRREIRFVASSTLSGPDSSISFRDPLAARHPILGGMDWFGLVRREKSELSDRVEQCDLFIGRAGNRMQQNESISI